MDKYNFFFFLFKRKCCFCLSYWENFCIKALLASKFPVWSGASCLVCISSLNSVKIGVKTAEIDILLANFNYGYWISWMEAIENDMKVNVTMKMALKGAGSYSWFQSFEGKALFILMLMLMGCLVLVCKQEADMTWNSNCLVFHEASTSYTCPFIHIHHHPYLIG